MNEFWKEPPVRPLRDWRTYLIGLPVLSSATGAWLFMARSFSFAELAAIPQVTSVRLVIVAAFATAFGSAFGSIGSGIEIYRKAFERSAIWLDWISLILSVLATLAGLVMGFAAVLRATEEWSVAARTWGPVVLSALVALDAAGDLIELGGLFAAYNVRYAAWLVERKEWNDAHGATAQSEPKAETNAKPVQLTVARKPDFDRILDRLNGNRESLTEQQLADELAKDALALPSQSTVNRWLRMARK